MKTELAIIGAGPAGMAAAETAIECGVDVTLIDEQATPGGQIYRQPPRDFRVSGWLGARTYRHGKALLQRVSANRQVRWLMQANVCAVLDSGSAGNSSRFTLLVHGKKDMHRLMADAVLIAAGCYDLPVIFPGWNLPGVMATGGIQAWVKSQQFIPGERFLFVGSHPLQLVVADQIVQAGGSVAGVMFPQSHARVFELFRAPAVILQNLDKLLLTAAALWRLRAAGVPVQFKRTLLQANGQESLHSVTTAPIGADGVIQRAAATEIDCDRLGVCFGFLASSELARQVGAACTWNTARGGWIVSHDEWMGSSLAGLYVAGEITGVAGAEVAALKGRLAALGCAATLGRITLDQAGQLSRSTRRQLRRLNRFADALSALAWPGMALLEQLMTGSATLCKCEEVTVEAFEQMLQQNPQITTANAAKLFSRVGMGLCQGRYCQHAVTQLMARRLGVSEQHVGGFTARFPAQPVAIDELLAAAD